MSVHESAHAWSALQLGDDTGSREGRISLNPLVHIDLVGTVIFPLLLLFSNTGWLFGWAKPTPIQPRNFRNMRQGQVLSAAAGPISNFLLAIGFAILYGVALRATEPGHPLVALCYMALALNVILAVFNLIPVPPLDGSWVASWGLPRRIGQIYDRIVEPYGFLILMLLFLSGILGVVLNWFAAPVIYFLRELARSGVGA